MTKRKNAFTLAEMLITLFVIGIVAAMTLPTMITKYQKKQTVSTLQKRIATLQQAMKLSEAENGEANTWFLPNNTHAENTKYFAEKYLFPYIKTINTSVPASDVCWSNDTKTIGGQSAYLFTSVKYPVSGCATLVDGSSLYFWASDPTVEYHTKMYTDINGHLKGPNMLGKDIFELTFNFNSGKFLYLNKDRVELLSSTTETGCNKENTSPYAGALCSSVIINDGWQIKEDYPW